MRMSSRKTVARAKSLRSEMTLPEVLLWRALRGRPGGYKFRRQHPAGPNVLDFCCTEAALCIEVDGLAHDMGANPQRDGRRDAWLVEQGIQTLRISAAEVLRDLEPVTKLIVQRCASRSPSTIPDQARDGPPPLQMQGRI